ncbi:hypothetical protein GCM10012284_02740 [Mangrovihabitans endophyticus]|uniref:Fibronectin type-III domain-containing protein n=1 Tax=Mangrovihabitans endophyticus TaxID=1751298 RepID=A0A8J3BVZ9_9ACTN|nr:hypothetical protein GCM10012284_02740 [Mangrovihabitans endophyticus]
MTIGTVLSLVTGLGLTALGLGAADQAVASFDAASWVWSTSKGEMARINGVTAKVDTRVDVPRARGHQLQVSQNDRFVILRDVNTGQVGTMDLASLKEFQTLTTQSGIGVSVALGEHAAFIVDAVRGEVQQIDPHTLAPMGQPLRYPPGITGGSFDGTDTLWVGVPGQGTVSGISPATGGGTPQVRTESVAAPNHDLAVSTLDDGVAVLDRTTNALTMVRGDQVRTTTVPLTGPGTLAAHTDGRAVPITVPDDRQVVVVGDEGVRATFTVPGDGTLQPAVAWQGYVYVPEAETGRVHVFDAAGRPRDGIAVDDPGGLLDLEVRENYLFINAPGASTARVVDDAHHVRTVDKYADDVLGGDPPPTPPDPPPPPKKPKKPPVTEPGAPRNVHAAAGNAQARVTWQAADDNGAAITRYVVRGAGRTFQVGADQRALEVTGLTNGKTYRFEVWAVNKKGDGPSRTSNPVRPTAEVPDPPASATAQAKPDGTVVVSWPAANGQGLDIVRYEVTGVAEGGSAPVGDARGTSLTIKAGALDYGKQYAFTVVAVNERGAGSQASPISETVVPYARPEQPGDVDAATVGDKAGTVRVTWSAPADNGRPISRYEVTAGDRTVQATDTSAEIGGFGAGQDVAVRVRAVNAAGASEPGTATARTVAEPKLTVTGSSATFNTATVSFSVDAGGGTAACSASASSGGGAANGNCSTLTVGGLKPSTAYTVTVTAKNAAGTVTATAKRTTAALYGTATCNNGEEGDTATYCDEDRAGRNGNEIFSVPDQNNDKQVGWAKPGTRLQSYCKVKGDDVDSYIYNHHKHSTWWVKVNYKGKNYIPWAWLNLDGGDDLGDLPAC